MLHTILTIIVVVLFVLDTLLLLGVGGIGFLSQFAKGNHFIVSTIILSQLPIFYFIVYKSYIGPVQKLNREIAKFMTGVKEDLEVEPNTLSK